MIFCLYIPIYFKQTPKISIIYIISHFFIEAENEANRC